MAYITLCNVWLAGWVWLSGIQTVSPVGISRPYITPYLNVNRSSAVAEMVA